jgi:hypothetical protein
MRACCKGKKSPNRRFLEILRAKRTKLLGKSSISYGGDGKVVISAAEII